jgi:hypothetical protein
MLMDLIMVVPLFVARWGPVVPKSWVRRPLSREKRGSWRKSDKQKNYYWHVRIDPDAVRSLARWALAMSCWPNTPEKTGERV